MNHLRPWRLLTPGSVFSSVMVPVKCSLLMLSVYSICNTWANGRCEAVSKSPELFIYVLYSLLLDRNKSCVAVWFLIDACAFRRRPQPVWLLERWWVLGFIPHWHQHGALMFVHINSDCWCWLVSVQLLSVKTVPRSKRDMEADSKGQSMPVPARSSSLKPSAQRYVDLSAKNHVVNLFYSCFKDSSHQQKFFSRWFAAARRRPPQEFQWSSLFPFIFSHWAGSGVMGEAPLTLHTHSGWGPPREMMNRVMREQDALVHRRAAALARSWSRLQRNSVILWMIILVLLSTGRSVFCHGGGKSCLSDWITESTVNWIFWWKEEGERASSDKEADIFILGEKKILDYAGYHGDYLIRIGSPPPHTPPLRDARLFTGTSGSPRIRR